MYIYVTKFEKYPELIKIGKSINPEIRTSNLVKTHGGVISTQVFNVGSDYSEIERLLHYKYRGKKSTGVVGDGCTEFFCHSITNKVYKDLEDYIGGTFFNLSQLKDTMIREEIRYFNIMAKLFGKRGFCYSGKDYEMPPGSMFGIQITHCVEVGFSKEEAIKRFVDSKVAPGFTTVGRVSAAYELFLNGSKRYRLLNQMVKEYQK